VKHIVFQDLGRGAHMISGSSNRVKSRRVFSGLVSESSFRDYACGGRRTV